MAQLTGAFLLLLTMNVLKFYEQTNVITKGGHFIKRFPFTKSRVQNFLNCYEQHG
jgi:hypothetical protein